MPLYIVRSNKKRYLNLNNYRNWHFHLSNQIKKDYKNLVNSEMQKHRLIKFKKISLEFVLHKGNKGKIDRSNALSIHEKFFCDALVELGFLIDDNDSFIESTHYYTGEIDKINPRVDIKITEL
jgi:Holliday junction resolvase RusA-like endonuclease